MNRLEVPAFTSGYAVLGLTCVGLLLLVPLLNLKLETTDKASFD